MSKAPKDPRRPINTPRNDEQEDDSRWRRPEDRFPTLPEDTPPSATLKDAPRRRRLARSNSDADNRDRSRNILALLFLIATFGVLAYFIFIWQNPYSTLNPLAPPTPLPIMITATFTPTLSPTPAPTRPPTATLTPSAMPSPEPTSTFTPVALEGTLPPPGIEAGTDDVSLYRFTLQRDRVIYLTNPDARGACAWSSIAGSVMNYDGTALNGYGVHVVGEGVDQTVGTGSAPGFGPGGFEVPLGTTARDAQYAAQLVDPQGIPVSPVYTVETNSDCELNIAALRFVESAPAS